MSGVFFDPSAPVWAIAVVSGIGALLIFWNALKQPVPAGFRMLALAALTGLLLNPQIRVAERTPLDDIALIVLDRSASQSLDARADAAEAAAELLETRLAALDVETKTVIVEGEEETRLIESLSSTIAETPRARLSGVFVISDGQAVDAENASRVFPAAPVHILSTGRDTETDRTITLINAPRYGIVNESVNVSFRVNDFGPDNELITDAQNAVVTLRVDGEDAFRQPVPIGAEVSFAAPLERPGALVIELEVEPRGGELTTRNNIAVLPITAIRDRLRVLLISGEPHAGERVWRNFLKSDPAIDLVHFTILRPLDKNDGALQNELALIEFPQDELFIEKLSEFDLLIFDRYTYRGVMNAFHFDNIARYVESGGAILIASGPEYIGPLSLAARQTLSFILPALPQRQPINGAFRPQVSEVGVRHPVTAGLPEQSFWGRWLRIIPVLQRSGRALMEGPNGEPLLILDRVGDGRIGLLLSDHVWLWARGFDGGGPHAELLRRIAHWLMKEPELEEEQLALRDDSGDLVIERRTMAENAAPIELTLPDGSRSEVSLSETSPGAFAARIESAPRGLYRARSGELFAVGAVGLAAAPEFTNVVSTPSKIAPLAERSGGGVFRLRRDGRVGAPAIRRVREDAQSRHGAGWAGVVTRNAEQTISERTAPAASPWMWLAVIVLALAGAWAVEGRFGRARLS